MHRFGGAFFICIQKFLARTVDCIQKNQSFLMEVAAVIIVEALSQRICKLHQVYTYEFWLKRDGYSVLLHIFRQRIGFLRLSFDIKRVNWNRLKGRKAVFFKKMIER